VGSGPSDAELVSRLRQARAGAFDELYLRYREPVWRFLRRLSGRQDWAEDLFQDTWLAAARNAHRLREDSELLPWLYTIARNKHRNAIRFRLVDRRRREEVGREPIAPSQGPDEDADARERARRTARAFARLPGPYREVLLLFFDEGLTTEAVARIVELREDAVRKRLSRARTELARLLEEQDAKGKGTPR
jgi:RNA polymerase sigma-70 factor (ECF subfamily)